MIRCASWPLLLLSLATTTTVSAAQDAHIHGEGRLNIAIDGNRLFLGLQLPGADIAGFEHAAVTEAEKSAVAEALARLRDPLQIFRLDADADCEVIEAFAGIEGDEEEHAGHEEHGEHEAHEENEAHEEHEAHEDHEEHDEASEHGAFVAEYELKCNEIEALTRIEFTYFEHFPNALLLDVIVIDAHGQRSKEVSRANPVLQIGR